MLLHANIPTRFWPFAPHATYLRNITSKTRCDPKRTIFEVLFNKQADVRRILPFPFGTFATVYKDRRSLTDQSFGFGLIPRYFHWHCSTRQNSRVCINTNGNNIHVSLDNISFDPDLYQFNLQPFSSPDWQNFYNHTIPIADGSYPPIGKNQSNSPKDDDDENVSPPSEPDPDFDSTQHPESSPIDADNETYVSAANSSESDLSDHDNQVSSRVLRSHSKPTSSNFDAEFDAAVKMLPNVCTKPSISLDNQELSRRVSNSIKIASLISRNVTATFLIVLKKPSHLMAKFRVPSLSMTLKPITMRSPTTMK